MKNQICTSCNKLKEIKSFEHQKNRKNPRKKCKKCRISERVYTDEQRESRKKYALEQRNNPAYFEKYKNSSLQRNYNINLSDYKKMLKNQKERCAICKNKFKSSKNTHVDHNHNTLKVRELLCSGCNAGIGLLKENIKTLKSAVEYIKRHE